MRISVYTFLLIFFAIPVLAQTNTPKRKEATSPFVLWVIDEIESSQLAEKRTLNIYLPEGYKENDTTRYPVIYLLDGSADEDFIHVVGLVQFNTFPWINRIPKSIVVGIANVDRRRDFTYPTNRRKKRSVFPRPVILISLSPLSKKNYSRSSTRSTGQIPPEQ